MKIIMNHKEIEIKLQIDEDNYYRLLALMESTAAFQSKKHQVDIYYSPENESYYDNGDRCLRIRSENNKSILSYKRINGEGTRRLITGVKLLSIRTGKNTVLQMDF